MSTRKAHFGNGDGPRPNKRRGDKTPLELFIAGVRGWEAYPRRWLDDGKPVGYVTWRFTMWDTRSASAAVMSPTPPGAIEVRASVDRMVRKQHS